jgi:hypothetical protein
MNNVGKPALYGLTQPTIGKFFPRNCLIKTEIDKIPKEQLNELY